MSAAVEASSPTEITQPARRRLGRYQLCLELASGGMATVYLARADGPAGFEKLLALKTIHEHLVGEQQFVDMFLDEARIASRIGHPNVCQVFDFGETDGTHFIAMEYLVGESLRRVIKALIGDSELRVEELVAWTARIVADACEGLHAAHELRGADGELLRVVHRDISPQNLFVTYDGACKVVDFGIASARDRLHTTNTGEVKGKFGYMAPEQLEAKPLDRRADIWALGVVLWEMLAMRRLFRRSSEGATVTAVLNADVDAPSTVQPGLPPALDAIVLKALSRDPDERYATARELGTALLPFASLDGAPVGLPHISEMMERVLGEDRRRKLDLVELAKAMETGVPSVAEDTGSSVRTVEPLAARKRRSRMPLLVVGAVALLAAGVGLGALRPWETTTPETAAAISTVAEEPPPSPVAAPVAEPPVAEPPVAEAPAAEAPVAEPAAAAEASDEDTPSPAAETPEEPTPDEPTPRSRPPARARRGRTRPPRAQPQAAAVAPTGEGRVAVATPGGWASVRLAGRELGTTPCGFALPAGRHVLSVHPFGRTEAIRVPVTVRPGETTRVRRNLN